MSQLAKLQKPLKRRIGDLVVEITPDGIAIRGFGRKKRLRLSWEQVAFAAADSRPAIVSAETKAGERVLDQIKPQPRTNN